MSAAPENDAVNETVAGSKPPFLRRVRIRGYKSIAFCDVALEPLTIFVGRNASGKSNFLDALAFLRDVMETSAPEAVKRRGGWSSVLCRAWPMQKIEIEITAGFTCERPYWRSNRNGPSALTPPDMGTAPDLTGATFTAHYNLEVSVGPHSPPTISRERLELVHEGNQWNGGFEVHNGIISRWRTEPHSASPLRVPHPRELLSVARPDQPLLSMIGVQPFIDLGDGLRWMGFHNFHPDAIRTLQKPNPGWLMDRDGRNLASVIEDLKETDPDSVQRVRQYLSAIVEQVETFDVVRYGEYETVRFRVACNGEGQPLEFDAASMSDGTLRALAALTAAFQIHLPTGPSVIGIEEPEAALHPAAMRALVDALDEATLRTQILLTTHSPDLLDAEAVKPENIRVVEWREGSTAITPVDEASVSIVRDHFGTLGGLERDRQLELNLDDLDRQAALARQERISP